MNRYKRVSSMETNNRRGEKPIIIPRKQAQGQYNLHGPFGVYYSNNTSFFQKL